MLALEINRLTGKRDPCKRLFFEHPTDGGRGTRPAGHSTRPNDGEGKEPSNEDFEKEFVVGDGGVRSHADQDAFGINQNFSDFVGDSPKIRRRKEEVDESSERRHGNGGSLREGAGSFQDPSETRRVVGRKIVNVGVSDISAISELSPLSFKLLEPAPDDYAGTLAALIETLRRMQKLIPEVLILSSLCLLPPGKSISRTGQRRRPCLVATLYNKNQQPAVLLDIDHTDLSGLAAIGLRFPHAFTPDQMEKTIKDVLSDLVGNSGSWSSDLENKYEKSVEIIRIKRMLRKKSQLDDEAYQTRWAVLLIKKLGI